MINLNLKIVKSALSSFFKIFGAQIIELYVDKEDIKGIIEFCDDKEQQAFLFRINDFTYIDYILLENICNFLVSKKLVDGDKLILSESEILEFGNRYGLNSVETNKAIDDLCSFEVKMIDNNIVTDSFFLHF